MIGFTRRFDPIFSRLKARIAGGEIGELVSLIITSHDPVAPPQSYAKVSGGLFRDMAIHDFDMARWLLDEDIETIASQASVRVAPHRARWAMWIRSPLS